jgi:hypothetical protein
MLRDIVGLCTLHFITKAHNLTRGSIKASLQRLEAELHNNWALVRQTDTMTRVVYIFFWMPNTKTLLICSKVSTSPTLVVSSSWCSRRKKYIYQGWSQGCFRAFMPITCVCLPSTLWHSLSQSQTFVPWLYPEHLDICEWLLKCISFLFPLWSVFLFCSLCVFRGTIYSHLYDSRKLH